MADAQEAVEFLRESNDYDSENRQLALTALQFSYGDQWPQYAVTSRGNDRPQLTINETNTYIKKITNSQRQQRPRGKASPVDSYADVKIAKVITGLGRHIEVNSDADNAYDTAFDFAARIGWGYWRLRADYIDETSRDQDIYIDVIDNPFSVYRDPNSKLPDGSDSERMLLTDMMRKANFKIEYPGAQMDSFQQAGAGDTLTDWTTEHDIRLAEYFNVDRKRAKLVYLSDGSNLFEDEFELIRNIAFQSNITAIGDRPSFKRVIKWRKQTCYEVLEEKDLPGRWIPVIPVYWTNTIVNGKRVTFGLVKDAIDPQRMLNFWQTSITESIALAPKAKWLGAEGFDEGHENEYKNANNAPNPVLRYKTTGVDGQAIPPPERIAPELPPAGAIEASFMASQNLSRVLGVFDPATRGGAQHKSDKTLNAERSQSENTNFDGYDNLTRSIKHTWRVILSWVPVYFDTKRVARIIGEDGREQMVTLNEPQQAQENTEEGAIAKVLNDVRIGSYDVVMQTGPGYDTKRQEGVAATMDLLNTPIGEKVAQTADDLIVRAMDFPGADVIADRLAAANPLSQIDEKSDVPPQAQMMIKGLQGQLQQATQMITGLQTELKYKTNIEGMKQQGETQRKLMETTAKAHDVNERNLSMQHSTEVKALTAQNVEELKGLTQLLLNHLDTARLEKEAQRMDVEQQSKAAENASAQT